jgi:hypothetical protein
MALGLAEADSAWLMRGLLVTSFFTWKKRPSAIAEVSQKKSTTGWIVQRADNSRCVREQRQSVGDHERDDATAPVGIPGVHRQLVGNVQFARMRRSLSRRLQEAVIFQMARL